MLKVWGFTKTFGLCRVVLALSSGPVCPTGRECGGWLCQSWNRLQQEWEEPGLQENHKFYPELGHADKRIHVNTWERGPLMGCSTKILCVAQEIP